MPSYWPIGGGGGGQQQTPWLSDINAAQFKLVNATEIDMTAPDGSRTGLLKTDSNGVELNGTGANGPVSLFSPNQIKLLSQGAIAYTATGTVGPAHQFITNGTISALVIDGATSKVGIGTGAPVAELQVAKGSAAVADFKIGDDSDAAAAGNGWKLWSFSDGNNYCDSKTTANGLTFFRTGQGSEVGSSRGYMTVVASNGRIGMGLNNPGYSLDVLGDVNCSGSFRVNGTPLTVPLLATDDRINALTQRIADLEARLERLQRRNAR